MSLIDQLLSQQIVLISVGVFFLFIAAAIGVAVYQRIKARRVKIAKRKAAEKAAKEAAIAEAKAAKEAARAARRGGRQTAAAAQTNGTTAASTGMPTPTAAGTPAGAAPVAGGTASAAVATPKPALLAATPASTPTEKKEEVSPEMQDLLSSVFADEENSERQQILLQGTESVSIEELLILSKSVMAQINGEQQSNIVRVKEKELS